jgi:hypothetical protein
MAAWSRATLTEEHLMHMQGGALHGVLQTTKDTCPLAKHRDKAADKANNKQAGALVVGHWRQLLAQGSAHRPDNIAYLRLFRHQPGFLLTPFAAVVEALEKGGPGGVEVEI